MCDPYGLFHDYVAIWLSYTLFLRLLINEETFPRKLAVSEQQKLFVQIICYLYISFAIIRDNMEFWVDMWDFGCTTLIFVWGTLRFHKSAFRCILKNVLKSYEGVVTNTQTTMRMHQTPVTVFDLKGAIKDRFQYMKDHGILRRIRKRHSLQRSSRELVINVASKVTRVLTAGARKARKEAEKKKHWEPISVRALSA